MKYRILGNTHLRVSEIGFGGTSIMHPSALDFAIDAGINYIDTAPDYLRGESEKVIGKVMKARRKKVVLATKWHPYSNTKKEDMIKSLDASLQKLQTDYVDVLQVHNVGKASDGEGIKRLKNAELYEAMGIVKKQGKARFFGVTGHDGDLVDVMNYAIDTEKFNTILCRYSFLDYPKQNTLFKKAKNSNIGVIAMKTLAGAKSENLRRFRNKNTTYAQAALRWVLSNPNISTLIISIANKEQVTEYIKAVDRKFGLEDEKLLKEYAYLHSNEYCRMCNECETSCVHNVAVARILRYRMYSYYYNDLSYAKELYQGITDSQKPNRCFNCSAPCEKICRFNVPIKKYLVDAKMLFLNERNSYNC